MEGVSGYSGSLEALESILGALKSLLLVFECVATAALFFSVENKGAIPRTHMPARPNPPPFDDTIYHLPRHAG